MRLDAAPRSVYRGPLAKAVPTIGGVAASATPDDPATLADESAPTPPPPSDGKGTLINTYA